MKIEREERTIAFDAPIWGPFLSLVTFLRGGRFLAAMTSFPWSSVIGGLFAVEDDRNRRLRVDIAGITLQNDGSFNFLGREMHWKKPYWANGHIILEAIRVYVWFFILDEEKRATFFFLFFSSVYLQRFWAGIAVGLEMIWTVYLAWQISIVWLEYESVSAHASIKFFSILAKKEWK